VCGLVLNIYGHIYQVLISILLRHDSACLHLQSVCIICGASVRTDMVPNYGTMVSLVLMIYSMIFKVQVLS
jgi:hypothetical protein